jgi:hypothetical protein
MRLLTPGAGHPSHPPPTVAMSDSTDQPKKERFAPKEPVTLQPPKDDIIERDHLAKCDGQLYLELTHLVLYH